HDKLTCDSCCRIDRSRRYARSTRSFRPPSPSPFPNFETRRERDEPPALLRRCAIGGYPAPHPGLFGAGSHGQKLFLGNTAQELKPPVNTNQKVIIHLMVTLDKRKNDCIS